MHCKGADTVILERLGPNQLYTDRTLAHLEEYASSYRGTPDPVMIVYHDVPDAEYRQWSIIYDQAAQTINGRGDALDNAAELMIEKDVLSLGATAIGDKASGWCPGCDPSSQISSLH